MGEVPDAKAALAAEIAKLQASYRERLPAELAELEQLATALAGGESGRAALDDLHHRLHKLAGSGGTFGLGELSQQARQLEQTAKEWLAGSLDNVAAASWRRFGAGVAALAATLPDAGAIAGPGSSSTAPMGETGQIIHAWLVEGDAPLGRELVWLLGQFGYEVQVFTRFADAEAAAAAGRPDALIMDAMFAEQGGGSTAAVTTSPVFRGRDCPLLFISDSGDFPSRVRAARLGAEGFFVKPLDLPRLAARLEGLFGERRAAAYRVLVVDDDVTLSEHYRLVLKAAGMEAEVLNRPEEIIQRLTGFRPDLVLLDMYMPGYSGPDLAMVIRQYDEWLGLPIVYLSAETDLDKQIHALGRGGDDFLTKPISNAQLVAAVRTRAVRSRQLADLMSKDSLTGLLKHARIKEEIDVALVRSRRGGKPVSVAMLDIDHFKLVNDTYGHAVGDRVIQAIAHLLRQRLRKSDGIGRYGGEEFVALLTECDIDTARGILDDIRERFAALRFQHDGQEFGCALSAGIACSAQLPQASGGELLVAADEALYAAKHGGRNQVRVAGPKGTA